MTNLNQTQQDIINYFSLWAPSESGEITINNPAKYWFKMNRRDCQVECGSPYDFDAAFDGLIEEGTLEMKETVRRSGRFYTYFIIS